MTTAEFKKAYQGSPEMTRKVSVLVVETVDGYLLARAEGPAGVAYCGSRTTSKAMGRAASAVTHGDFQAAEAFDTPEEALEYARRSRRDWH